MISYKAKGDRSEQIAEYATLSLLIVCSLGNRVFYVTMLTIPGISCTAATDGPYGY